MSDSHGLSDGGVLADRLLNHTTDTIEIAMYHRQIGLEGGACFKLACDGPVGFIGLGYHHDPCRVFIEPVDNAWAKLAGTDAAKPVDTAGVGVWVILKTTGGLGCPRPARLGLLLLGAIGQAIKQRARQVAACGVDNQARLFVDHEERFIFINNVYRDRLGRDGSDGFRGKDDVDHIAPVDHGACFGRGGIDGDTAQINQLLDPASADAFEPLLQVNIQPFSRSVFNRELLVFSGFGITQFRKARCVWGGLIVGVGLWIGIVARGIGAGWSGVTFHLRNMRVGVTGIVWLGSGGGVFLGWRAFGF